MDKRIERFIKRHHVMTLATIGDDGEAWCSNIFYAYLRDTQELVFTSGEDTQHVAHLMQRPEVAASIVLESRVVGKLQGLQIRGVVRAVSESRMIEADVASSGVAESQCRKETSNATIRHNAPKTHTKVKREEAKHYREAFLKAFPYAVFSLKELWALEITHAKYTDNTLGFGTKLIYKKIKK